MPNGKKKKGHKMATHKRKKKIKEEQTQEQVNALKLRFFRKQDELAIDYIIKFIYRNR